MSEQRSKLTASKDAAQEAKDAFASKYVNNRDDLAVGLGVNESGDAWAVMVFAESTAAAQSLPDHFGNFAVEVRVTGPAKAF